MLGGFSSLVPSLLANLICGHHFGALLCATVRLCKLWRRRCKQFSPQVIHVPGFTVNPPVQNIFIANLLSGYLHFCTIGKARFYSIYGKAASSASPAAWSLVRALENAPETHLQSFSVITVWGRISDAPVSIYYYHIQKMNDGSLGFYDMGILLWLLAFIARFIRALFWL